MSLATSHQMRDPEAATMDRLLFVTHPLNKRESLRSELFVRQGRTVIRIGRWKADGAGALRPAGVGLECSADHIDGLREMLAAIKKQLTS
jgi:hypothetical protein